MKAIYLLCALIAPLLFWNSSVAATTTYSLDFGIRGSPAVNGFNPVNAPNGESSNSLFNTVSFNGTGSIQVTAATGGVAAKSSDSFVASIGVAGHIGDSGIYTSQWFGLESALGASGIRIFRSCSTSPTGVSEMQDLFDKYGVKCIVGMDPASGIRPTGQAVRISIM